LIPDLPIAMIRPDLRDLPEASLPEGYSLRAWTSLDEGLWLDIHRDAEPLFQVEDDLFERNFGDDRDAALDRVFFIVDGRGVAVGTIAGWYSDDYYGQPAGRIHWVAVRPSHRRLGLARGALAEVLGKMAHWHDRAWLLTSTARMGAVRLYLDFGFRPDLRFEEAEERWALMGRHLDHPALKN
jgi:GNAT superfamily N-acetyltransferase